MAGAKQQFYKGDQLTASPYFTSLAKRYSAQVGAGVTLNCKVENLGESEKCLVNVALKETVSQRIEWKIISI